jgi:hypothetical protein
MAYQDTQGAALATRQAAHVAATTNAQHIAAEIAFYQSLLTAGRTFGVHNNAVAALHALGVDVSGVPGD